MNAILVNGKFSKWRQIWLDLLSVEVRDEETKQSKLRMKTLDNKINAMSASTHRLKKTLGTIITIRIGQKYKWDNWRDKEVLDAKLTHLKGLIIPCSISVKHEEHLGVKSCCTCVKACCNPTGAISPKFWRVVRQHIIEFTKPTFFETSYGCLWVRTHHVAEDRHIAEDW